MDQLTERNIVPKLAQICKEQGLPNYQIKEVRTNPKGEGYIGQIFFVDLIDETTKKQLEVIVKVSFRDEKIREQVPIRVCFENEIYFYSEVLPLYKKFTNSNGLDCLEFIPKCFYCSLDDEILILENLKSRGFDTFDKRATLDKHQMELIFKTYGIFHGISFAYKEQYPEKFMEISKKFNNVFDNLMDAPFFSGGLAELCVLINTYFTENDDKDLKEKFAKYTSSDYTVGLFRELVDCDDTAFIHGDCHSNNMLFRFQNNQVSDVRFIDFQLAKTGNPTCDLSYFFYTGGCKTLYDSLDDFLMLYYDSLNATMSKLGSDAKKLYPFEKLQADWRKFSKVGLFMSLMLFKMKASLASEVKDFTDDIAENETMDMNFDQKLYKSKIFDLLYHMHEYDAL